MIRFLDNHEIAGDQMAVGLTNQKQCYPENLDRFMSLDPIGFAGDTSNLYRYVGNSPTMATDPSGRIPSSGGAAGTADGDDELPSSRITPYELGWEWLTGSGPKHRDFDADAYMTKELRKHSHVQDSIDDMKTRVSLRAALRSSEGFTRSYPYSLAGSGGVLKYFYDYSTLVTGGATGNLVVTYLGSYSMSITASEINCDKRTAKLSFIVTNSTTLASGTRPPWLGYTEWWQLNVAPYINDWASQGGMSEKTQEFRWTEEISY